MNDREDNPQGLEVPEPFRAALSRLENNPIPVPPKVDEAILQSAREHLRQGSREGVVTAEPARSPLLDQIRAGWTGLFATRRWVAWGGVAVMIVAVGVLARLDRSPRLAARPEDLNGDGVVDMLDAFALARELQLNPASHPQLDLNGDGIVDGHDVQVLAARAVRLEQGGRS